VEKKNSPAARGLEEGQGNLPRTASSRTVESFPTIEHPRAHHAVKITDPARIGPRLKFSSLDRGLPSGRASALLTNRSRLLHRKAVQAATKPLSNLAVWVIDCQTTGASPAHGVVLEIGWGLCTAGSPRVERAEAHWVALPPGERVSPRVRQLTGFDEAMANVSLDAPEVWRRLRAGMEHAERVPAAIHFASFELAFLRDWSSRFEPGSAFPFDAVCLHAIAARLHPDLPRQSLRALAGFLGHGLDLTRRCAAHVEATAFIWHRLAAELRERGIASWEELSSWLAAPKPPRAAGRKRRFPLPSARYRSLPDVPGVYRFLRANGDLLYVGKAASLKKRVSGHFTAGLATTPRALEMLTQIHDIQVTPSASALEAALLENEEIKGRRPLYNLQLTDDGHSWFMNARLDSFRPVPDAEHRHGPLPSTFSPRAVGAIRALLSGAAPSRELRASAVETWERWAPDEVVFGEGFRRFVERHAELSPMLSPGAQRLDPRRVLAVIARRLLAQARPPGARAEEAELALEGDEPAASVDSWDRERVLRHLERAVAHGHQLLARARWLCLLCDSVVVFREPGSERTRQLVFERGQLIEARDAGAEEAPAPKQPLRPVRERRAAFDRSQYDRLRTLTTELKRIQRDGGTVNVQVARRRWLSSAALARLLAAV
jgi:DNA polymerase III epsilon subunit-like protein